MSEDRYDIIADAIEQERKAEEAYFRSLSQNKTIKERITAGVLWFPVDIEKIHYSVAEKIEIVMVPAGPRSTAGSHRFRVGASAVFWVQGEERLEWKGVISFSRRLKVSIILNQDGVLKDHIVKHSKCGIELVYDDRSYRVMANSLRKLKGTDKRYLQELREGVRHRKLQQQDIPNIGNVGIADKLNESQKKAVEGCLRAERMGIIHGPPGTGKTTTLVSFASELLKAEKRILVTAPSNNAVDLLTRKLSETGISVLRVGNVTRIGDSISHLTLAEKMRNHKDWQHIKQVKIEADNAQNIAGKHKRKFGQQQRGERSMMKREARELKKWARELENRLSDQILESAQVICSTLIGCAHPQLEGMIFDTLIIDEASQALEAESWTAILRAKRVIMAGDHQQLPPTVKSSEALKLGLGETILDRMTDQIESTFLLDTQYRMHEQILHFSNEQFYNGRLQTASFVQQRGIKGDEEVVTFIDTSGCGFNEKTGPEGRSYNNIDEFHILREHFMANAILQDPSISIGVICPYSYQVTTIRGEISQDEFWHPYDIEVNSIDGFQGQEKDVIYISFVRSNDRGEVGFLKDGRRLNVALTRARYKLIMIGDMSTLAHEPLYDQLAQHVEKHGAYKSAWEYMG
ncbi:MAG: ATP-dependent RNA/DNA helicase IGHMBP2 [Saprospiraceae bacterium]|jgi:ATP-dependent RNA/DNA helicase IGHMBP2